jgi:hypothetical protein
LVGFGVGSDVVGAGEGIGEGKGVGIVDGKGVGAPSAYTQC